MDDVLNIEEASAYLKLSRAALYKLARSGKIPGFKIGSIWRFHKDSLKKWMHERIQKDTAGCSTAKDKKQPRSMKPAGNASTEWLVSPKQTVKTAQKARVSPQLSCTISQEDMDFLQQLGVALSAKTGRMLNLSQIVRSLIAYGKQHKDSITLRRGKIRM